MDKGNGTPFRCPEVVDRGPISYSSADSPRACYHLAVPGMAMMLVLGLSLVDCSEEGKSNFWVELSTTILENIPNTPGAYSSDEIVKHQT